MLYLYQGKINKRFLGYKLGLSNLSLIDNDKYINGQNAAKLSLELEKR